MDKFLLNLARILLPNKENPDEAPKARSQFFYQKPRIFHEGPIGSFENLPWAKILYLMDKDKFGHGFRIKMMHPAGFEGWPKKGD